MARSKALRVQAKDLRSRNSLGNHWQLHLMVLPALICLLLFCYLPMSGIIVAFKDYSVRKGILGSPWAGLKHFESILTDPFIFRALKNTVIMSLLRLVIVFPAPIILALMFNEMRGNRLRKTFQTISYFPYFVSWVVVCAMVPIWLSTQGGWVNAFLQWLGVIDEPIVFLADGEKFYWITIILELWKGTGFSAIIYIAAISGIEQEQYEAATIDGASRFQKMRYITLPSLAGTISLMFILQLSGMINGNFDVSYLLGNSSNSSHSMILQSYTYSVGIAQGRFSYATAVGLITGVVSTILLLAGNKIVKKATKTQGLF